MKIIINSGGKNTGPFSWEQVRELLKEGTISETDYAWLGEGEWITVAEVMVKFKPPVSLTARLNKATPKEDPRTKTNLLQLRARKSSSLTRPLY